jgi:anti-sigma regulatory factor (Ser/Thr protein kinase)
MTATAFRHGALLYDGDEAFVDAVLPFLEEGLELDEAMLAVVSATKIEQLRRALGRDHHRITFADMAAVGRNPARIIPAWQSFVDRNRDAAGLRGIGEPAFVGRSDDELVECHQHEALLNVAFGGGRPWSLLCPYDTVGLDGSTVRTAAGTHPYLCRAGASGWGETHRETDAATVLAGRLPAPPERVPVRRFGFDDLAEGRAFVESEARRCGVSEKRLPELLIAVNELLTNSVTHGGGSGTVRVWRRHDTLCCEVADRGVIRDPLAGRRRPALGREGGRGLWITNQLCDLVQLRSEPGTGTTVRVHASLG